jgi:hypothetical protein
MGVKTLQYIYQLKVTIIDSKPPVWRRVLVPSDINLARLHDVLQIVMGWTDTHLHQYVFGGTIYGVPDEDRDLFFGMIFANENESTLSSLLNLENDSMIYEYDFGDSWEHKIVLEKKIPNDNSISLPACIKGRMASPPENCGGIPGYQELLEIISTPSHPDYTEYIERLGGNFDPERFDMSEVNRHLSETAHH